MAGRLGDHAGDDRRERVGSPGRHQPGHGAHGPVEALVQGLTQARNRKHRARSGCRTRRRDDTGRGGRCRADGHWAIDSVGASPLSDPTGVRRRRCASRERARCRGCRRRLLGVDCDGDGGRHLGRHRHAVVEGSGRTPAGHDMPERDSALTRRDDRDVGVASQVGVRDRLMRWTCWSRASRSLVGQGEEQQERCAALRRGSHGSVTAMESRAAAAWSSTSGGMSLRSVAASIRSR